MSITSALQIIAMMEEEELHSLSDLVEVLGLFKTLSREEIYLLKNYLDSKDDLLPLQV